MPVTVNFADHHLPDGSVSNHFVWAVIEGIAPEELYKPGSRAQYVHNGSIRWGADDHQYNTAGLQWYGKRILQLARGRGFKEVASWNGFVAIRFQIDWTENLVSASTAREINELRFIFRTTFGKYEIQFGVAEPRS